MEQQQSSMSELEEKLGEMRAKVHAKDMDNEVRQSWVT